MTKVKTFFLFMLVMALGLLQAQSSSTTLAGNNIRRDHLSPIRIANEFPGSPDLGAQVNAADADLATSPGEIWLLGGGTFTSQAIVSSHHTVRVFEGVYSNALGEYTPPILLKDDSGLICESWQATIQNSSNTANAENVVVASYNATVGGSGRGIPNNSRATSTNLTVKGCHFVDGGTGNGSSLTGTVAFGNCKHCKVLNNFFDGMHGTHVTLVGSSARGGFGYDDEIAGNDSYGAKDAAFSVINNSNVNIHDNFFHGHGNGAAAFIDLEGNLGADYMQFIDIHDNVMDMTDAVNSVYGVTCNSAGPNQHNIKIHDNIMYGLNTSGNKFIQGIACGSTAFANSYTDVEIYNNQIYWTVEPALSIAGMPRAFIHDNRIHCGGGPAITIERNVFESVIRNNVVSAPLNGCAGTTSNYRVLQYTTIAEAPGADRNIFDGNVAGRITTSGANSKVVSNSSFDAPGKTERMPVGFSSLSGGVLVSQLSAPKLSVTTGATGSCALEKAQYFWRATAVDANGGETTTSNEVSQNAGGGFGCAILSWSFVPGAVSYNLYRSTITNAERLVASISDYALSYSDLGGQTARTPYPISNTTGGIVAYSNGVAGKGALYLTASDSSVDIGSVANGTCSTARTVEVLGAITGDVVNIVAGKILESGTFLIGNVPSLGHVSWQFCNLSGTLVKRGSDTYMIRVTK